MDWKKGMKRTVFVVSIIASISGFILVMDSVIKPSYKDFVLAVVWAGIFFGLVWVIYLIVLWIIKGFRD